MKKTILIGLLAIVLLAGFVGCEKEDPKVPLTECQKENIGYIAFYNTSEDAYDIWINNNHLKQQPGKSYTKNYLKLAAGRAYTITVRQVSGYVSSPTVKKINITMNQCDEKKIYFP